MTISIPPAEITRRVLGIDAAWTPHNPSGIALAVETAQGWRLAGVWPGYDDFTTGQRGGSAAKLNHSVLRLTGATPDLVTVDMPLSRHPIRGRREADRAVSRAYGGRGAATHSPTALRPGPFADQLRAGFAAEGFDLRTHANPAGRLAEVYPHPALIEFMGEARRLPYKISRINLYWPDATPSERRRKLIEQWWRILAMLDRRLPGTSTALPPPLPDAPRAALKSFEDQLDAVICSVVGIGILAGRANAFGDADATIWIPKSRDDDAR